MKKAGFSSLVFAPLLLLIVSPVFAETIIKTGNSSSDVNVQTYSNTSSTSQNSVTSHTHIEIDTNGDKKVLDEDGPGNYSLSSNSNGGTANASVNISNNSSNSTTNVAETENSTKSAGKKINHGETSKPHLSFMQNFFEHFKNFFQRIFANF